MQELKWISENQKEVEKYSGKWVAVTSKGIVAVGDSLTEVSKIVESKGISDVMYMKIPRKDEEMSIL